MESMRLSRRIAKNSEKSVKTDIYGATKKLVELVERVTSTASIEQVAKLSIAEIFQDEGESSFREIETQVLKEIGQRHSLVVATGGGVVTCIENWGILHQGIVIWVNPIRERLIERLKADADTRPLLGRENRIASLDKLMNDRHCYYSESDLNISVDKETPEEVAQLILQALKATLKNSQG